jgi:acetylornithine deacetylase
VTLDPVAIARDLISIDSVNPGLVRRAPGEGRAAAWCAEWLEQHGFDVTAYESVEGRPSIVGIVRGSGGGRSLMLNGHLDTVGVATWIGEPFTAEIRDGNLYGRGSFDMKGSVAAMLVAAARATGTLRGDVIVTLVADEEFGSHGTEEVLSHVTADAAIITEPSGLELTLAHRGFAWFEVEITGVAAHGSQPELGVDAIQQASRVMRALEELGQSLEAEPEHPTLGHGTVRVATINGGTDAATVAPSCTLTIERRFLPGESTAFVEQQLRDTIAAADSNGATTTVTTIVARGAFEADPDWPIVQAVARHAASVLGEATTRGEPFWTDAGLILEAGIPCLIIGVDGGGAHADVEWATVESIERLTHILEGTIREFCA